MTPLLLSACTATTCLGRGLDATRAALRAGTSGLRPCAFETVQLDTWIGEVAAVDAEKLPESLARFDCRNNRLALLGLETDGFAGRVRAAIARYGKTRVGVFLGTSTSGILQTELAYRRRDPATGALPADFDYRRTHNSFSLAAFTRDYFGLEGPAMVISTACSSSAKVFAAAARLIALGTLDAAVVGGVDTLCLTTLYGFNSLQLTSANPAGPATRPQRHLDRRGRGLRAARTRPRRRRPARPAARHRRIERCLPHVLAASGRPGRPAGDGSRAALGRAGAGRHRLHQPARHRHAGQRRRRGQGRRRAVRRPRAVQFDQGRHRPHAGRGRRRRGGDLRAGAEHGFLPGSPGTANLDPAIAVDYLLANRAGHPRRALSNSFGFGGTNCSLVLGVAA